MNNLKKKIVALCLTFSMVFSTGTAVFAKEQDDNASPKNDIFSQECELQATSFGDEVDVKMYPNRLDLQDLEFHFYNLNPLMQK